MSAQKALLSEQEAAFINSQRVAHLATADAQGNPHVVPVCFVFFDSAFWIAIDEKPKRTTRLKRLRNIEADPSVALVFDRYDEDWTRLGYVLAQGTAEIIENGANPSAIAALRDKYPQYRAMALEERPAIRITIGSVASWGDLSFAREA